MYKFYLYILIIISVFILSNKTAAENLLSWQELDRQQISYVKNIYSGEYVDVEKHFSLHFDENDMVDVYNRAIIYDRNALREYCRYCGICPKCIKPRMIDLPIDFSHKQTKSEDLYQKARELGHPYAGYMLYRQNMIQLETRLRRLDTKRILRTLSPYVEKGDGVASFMYFHLNGELKTSLKMNEWLIKRRKEVFDLVISRLKPEANEGRVLAMYYLGVIYHLHEDYVHSFAWFNAANKSGHWISGQYLKGTVELLIESGNAKKAVIYSQNLLKQLNSKSKH